MRSLGVRTPAREMTIEEIPLDVRPQVDVQNLLQLGQERDLTLEEIEDLYAQLFDVALEIEEESPPPQPARVQRVWALPLHGHGQRRRGFPK